MDKNISLKEVFKACLKVIKTMCRRGLNAFLKDLNRVAGVLEVCVPILFVWLNMSVLEAVLLSIICYIFIRFIKNVGHELNGTIESGMPIPERCFTKVDKDGFIGFKADGDRIEAIQYLNELEGYLRSKGVM